ncbi:hypothetical protein G7054_g9087 [Neopestalotiopsis clavispora]|nr:hypothetical protein G7054_g9087 [Neopestalotiopsis clavispora]
METLNHEQSRILLAKLSEECATSGGVGYMSTSIYDTAWLSMVQKPGDDGKLTWLFPECFQFVLDQQLPSGAWESYASPVDGILNTAAAILALRKRIKTCPTELDWAQRSQRAEEALRQLLADWSIGVSDQVGFELLVTQHLTLLEAEGVILAFPQYDFLLALRNAKLAKLPPSSVYQAPSTLYHSLEALIGHIDFDRVRCWKDSNGSMMSSPSSTAAYLMHASLWDDDAEAYLRNVVKHGVGKGSGGVPCAWPTTIFELTWAVTTLIGAGVVLDEVNRVQIGSFLDEALTAQNGVLGFCKIQSSHIRGPRSQLFPNMIAKTASFIIAQAYDGRVHEKWHTKDHYWMLLLAKSFSMLSQNMSLFEKLLELRPELKENVPMVTLYILIRLLRSQEANGSWDGICEVTSYAILALCSLSQLPWIQHLYGDGIVSSVARGKSFLDANRDEWRKGCYLWIEKLTYSSDLLSEVYCLAAALVPVPSIPQASTIPPAFALPEQMRGAMAKFSKLISRTPLCSSTGSHILRAAEMQACYALSALQSRAPYIFPRSAKGEDKYLSLIPLAFTMSAAAKGSTVSPYVLYEMMVLSLWNFLADEYMEGVVEKDFGDNLDAIKFIVRQIFLEFKLNSRHDSPGHPSSAPATSATTKQEATANVSMDSVAIDHCSEDGSARKQPTLGDIYFVLRSFVSHILHHPSVVKSPRRLQTRLAFELQAFLLAHITHCEDNHHFNLQRHHLDQNGETNGHERATHFVTNGAANAVNGIDTTNGQNKVETTALELRNPGRTFYNWVRSTSADHTSCPFSYIFFQCLVLASSGGKITDVFASPRTAYLAEDLCRHLSTLCRIQNDIGSIARDADEGNLNSINFPEFHIPSTATSRSVRSNAEARTDILWIAEYEQKALYEAFSLLKGELGPQDERIDALQLYISVTELYGQIYMVKDVGTRTK